MQLITIKLGDFVAAVFHVFLDIDIFVATKVHKVSCFKDKVEIKSS